MEDGYEQVVAELAQQDLHGILETYHEKRQELGDEARAIAYTAKELYDDLEETDAEFNRFAEGLGTYMSEEAEVVDDAVVETMETLDYVEVMNTQIGEFEGVPEEAKEATDRIEANNEEWFGED